MQGIVALLIGASYVLGPMAGAHAGVGSGIYFAERSYRHKKRIAAKFKMI